METTYTKIREQVGSRRGRKPLPAEERQRRMEARKAENRQRMEAKRRAWFVLENKYNKEFKRIFQEEFDLLKKQKYSVNSRKK
jgi:hypothetical protein